MNRRITFYLSCLVLVAACSSGPEVTNRDGESTIVATEAPTQTEAATPTMLPPTAPTEAATPTMLPPTAPAPFALDSIRPGQEMAYAFQATSGEVIHYWLYIPDSYDAGRSWPLIISLHGNLGYGQSLDLVREQSPTAFVGSEVDFPFIVVSPRAPDGPWDIYHEPMEELIGLLGESLSIDSEAQFITGMSTAVVGAWQWALAFPDRFTGLALIAGYPSSPLNEFDPEEACKLRDLPIWIGHSEADERVPIEPSRAAVMALEDCGSTKVTFTAYTDLSHAESFSAAFGGPELYDWMLALAK